MFFLEDDDDFILPEGPIQSPWIEYIMQAFAMSFARVGVDDLALKSQKQVKEYFKEL
jgi:hypothetical protein